MHEKTKGLFLEDLAAEILTMLMRRQSSHLVKDNEFWDISANNVDVNELLK